MVGASLPFMSSLLRRLYIAQLATSTVDGAVLTIATLFFAVISGFGEAVVGLALAAGALAGLLLSVPIGMLADRVGIARTAAALSGVAALAMVLFLLADTVSVYAAGAICWGVAQSSLLSLRQALAASQTPLEGRVRLRAMLHTLVNIGMGLGSAWGAAAIALGRHEIFLGTFVVNAVVYLLAGFGYLTMHASSQAAIARLPLAESPAWRDGRLLLLTALNAVLQFTLPVMSVLLPIWVVTRTAAPDWLPAAALVMNMLIVVAVQLRWATWVNTAARARASGLIAAAAALLACTVLGLAPSFDGGLASAAALVGVLLTTVTEVTGGAAAWFQLTRLSPLGKQGEFQAVFATSTTLARIIGPALLLPFAIGVGLPAWLAIGAAMALAGVLLASTIARHATPSV